MVDPSHEDRASDAAAYLARSADANERFGGNPKEIERQSSCLLEWAQSRDAFLTEAYFSGLEKFSGATAEHEVFYRASDNRAVKRTYPGTFGVTPKPKGQQTHSSPLFYLRRLELMNLVFGSNIRLEGIVMGKSLLLWTTGLQPGIVVSQPWIRAEIPYFPHPSAPDIEQFMESLGFRQLTSAYFGWHRESDGVTVVDARPDNFIKSPDGIVPIDLVITIEPLNTQPPV